MAFYGHLNGSAVRQPDQPSFGLLSVWVFEVWHTGGEPHSELSAVRRERQDHRLRLLETVAQGGSVLDTAATLYAPSAKAVPL